MRQLLRRIVALLESVLHNAAPQTDPERVINEFFRYGSQYYVAGRYAVFAGSMPVAGNLVHHAIEMFLKGALAKAMSSEKLKDKLGHRLRRIWNKFKNQANDPSLAAHDRTIKELDKFESIRYPDVLLQKGAAISFEITKTGTLQFKSVGVSQPQYKLCLEEIDEIVATIFRIATRSPKAFLTNLMRKDARLYLYRDNQSFTP